jgi:preprotein translocase subunit Sss1
MSFGTELWDQVKMVEHYVEAGDDYMQKVNDFLKNVVAAEEEYARVLVKASKPVKEEYLKKFNGNGN